MRDHEFEDEARFVALLAAQLASKKQEEPAKAVQQALALLKAAREATIPDWQKAIQAIPSLPEAPGFPFKLNARTQMYEHVTDPNRDPSHGAPKAEFVRAMQRWLFKGRSKKEMERGWRRLLSAKHQRENRLEIPEQILRAEQWNLVAHQLKARRDAEVRLHRRQSGKKGMRERQRAERIRAETAKHGKEWSEPPEGTRKTEETG